MLNGPMAGTVPDVAGRDVPHGVHRVRFTPSGPKAEYIFHQSWLQTFLHCPEQARDLYGKPKSPIHTDSTALGTAAHVAIAYALESKRDFGLVSFVEMRDVLHNELDALHPWTYTKYSDASVFTLATAACEQWYEHVEPLVEPLYVEHPFRKLLFEDDNYSIVLEGAIDCVDVDNVVWDWKTASRPYEEWEYQRWAVQPSAYCYAMDASTFYYAVMARGLAPQVFPVWRDIGHFNWMEQQAQVAVSYLQANLPTWQLNDAGWWCSPKWCPKFDECKGLFVPDNWQDSHAKREKYTP